MEKSSVPSILYPTSRRALSHFKVSCSTMSFSVTLPGSVSSAEAFDLLLSRGRHPSLTMFFPVGKSVRGVYGVELPPSPVD